MEILKKCVNAARLSPSGANLQPLEYIIVTKNLKEVYECLKWAGYLSEFNNSGQQPQAYIIILVNKKIKQSADIELGIVAENITLTALAENVSSCILGAINKEKMGKRLKLPEHLEIGLVSALGYADEKSKEVKIR